MAKLGLQELGVSAGYISLTCFIAIILRWLLNKIHPETSLAKTLLREAICAWELCASCFELIIVADNWGIWAYAGFLFILTIWWSGQWGECSACPYTHIEDIIDEKSNLITALAKTWAELSGALIVFGYVKLLWTLDYSPTHKGRAFEECTTDLQVPAVLGALVEFGGTCVYRVISKMIGAIEPRCGSMIDSFISTSLVVAAFNYSGGYYNPVLATSLKFGCKGATNAQHVVVYWLATFMGSILGVYVFRLPGIQSLTKRLAGKQE